MTERPALRPPSGGMAPPPTAALADGTELDLLPLAREITATHLAGHPEELERYGPAVRAWCTHDNQHLLNWAALDVAGKVDFDGRLRWLAGVLSARGYPLQNLADNLRTAAAVLERRPGESTRAVARRLASAADSV